MKPLEWSRMQSGVWNGKVGAITLMTVALHPERGWFVAPKLPGLRTVDVADLEEGRQVANKLWARWGREMGCGHAG
jgi:hypothetical protein